MNFRTGDRVKFLNEVGEGLITGFEDNNMANVMMADGFEIPFKITELVKIEGAVDNPKDETGMKQTIAAVEEFDIETPDHATINEENGLFLAFVKKDFNTFTLHLINDSDYLIHFVISKIDNETGTYLHSGRLEDNTKIIINTYKQEEINNLGSISFQALLYGKKSFEWQEPINRTIDFGKQNFGNKSFVQNDFFEEKAIIIKLENHDLAKELEKLSERDFNVIIKEKESKPKTVGDYIKKDKKQKSDGPEEVDLHIESIVDDHSHMAPGDIINAQLSRFEVALNGAIRGKNKRIVFIHGVGQGKLKYEMGKILDRKYPDLKYQDASFKEYGYGAMLVIVGS